MLTSSIFLKFQKPNYCHNPCKNQLSSLMRDVGIQGNQQVDSAAKAALNSPMSYFKILYTDFQYHIFKLIHIIWQSIWNKLVDLKPILGECVSCCCPLMVEHIVVQCLHLATNRNHFYSSINAQLLQVCIF